MLGVAIIGGGRVAHAHANAVRSLPSQYTLRVIVDVDEGRAAELGVRYECENCTDYRTILDREDIHAVAIALPNHLHAPVALDAITAGKHVFVEKPMALTLDECDALIEAARAANVKLMTGHTQHFFSANRKAHELIHSGAIGQLALMSDTWYKPFGLDTRLPWFLDRAMGGGMWQMNGAHMVDRMIWFSGSPVVAVKAWIGSPLLGQKSDDSAVVILHHANGLHATLSHAGYRVGVERWEGEFIGSEGMIKLSTFQPNAGLWISQEGQYVPVPFENHNQFALEFSEFAQCIADDTPEPITPEYARHIVAVLLAAEESARTGREVLIH